MDYAGFLREVDRGNIPPITLLHGPEPRLLDDALTHVTRALFPDPALLPLSREVFDAGETAVETIVRSALTLPFVTATRLVVVKGAQALSGKNAGALEDYLGAPNPSARLLFLAEEPLPTTHWLAKALPPASVVEVPRPTGRALVSWLRARAQEAGRDLAEPAAQLLVRWAGEDLTTLSGELEKALLFAGPANPSITEEEVRQVVGEHRVLKAFELTDAVERRRIGQALPLLENLLSAGEEPLAILGMLSRHVRMTWQVKEWLRQGKSPEEVGRILRRPAYAVETLAATANSLTPAALARALTRCWEAERRLKSGGRPRSELTVLVADLCGVG